MSNCHRPCSCRAEGVAPCRQLGEAPLPPGCARPDATLLMELRGWERFRAPRNLAALRQVLSAGALVPGPPGPDLGEELPEEERWDWWARSPLAGSSLRLLLAVAELTAGGASSEVKRTALGCALGDSLGRLLQEHPHREELIRRLTLGGSTPASLESTRTSDGCR